MSRTQILSRGGRYATASKVIPNNGYLSKSKHRANELRLLKGNFQKKQFVICFTCIVWVNVEEVSCHVFCPSCMHTESQTSDKYCVYFFTVIAEIDIQCLRSDTFIETKKCTRHKFWYRRAQSEIFAASCQITDSTHFKSWNLKLCF